MFVCVCNGVTTKKIETAIDNGAHTLKQLSTELHIGKQCGKCCKCTKKILNNKLIQISNLEPDVA